MIIWHNILHSYYHSDCKSVDDKEALWSYEREEGKRQTQERFIGPIRESQEPEGASCSTFCIHNANIRIFKDLSTISSETLEQTLSE